MHLCILAYLHSSTACIWPFQNLFLLFFGKHALVLFFSSGLLLCLVPNKNLLVPGLLQKSIQGFCQGSASLTLWPPIMNDTDNANDNVIP